MAWSTAAIRAWGHPFGARNGRNEWGQACGRRQWVLLKCADHPFTQPPTYPVPLPTSVSPLAVLAAAAPSCPASELCSR